MFTLRAVNSSVGDAPRDTSGVLISPHLTSQEIFCHESGTIRLSSKLKVEIKTVTLSGRKQFNARNRFQLIESRIFESKPRNSCTMYVILVPALCRVLFSCYFNMNHLFSECHVKLLHTTSLHGEQPAISDTFFGRGYKEENTLDSKKNPLQNALNFTTITIFMCSNLGRKKASQCLHVTSGIFRLKLAL